MLDRPHSKESQYLQELPALSGEQKSAWRDGISCSF